MRRSSTPRRRALLIGLGALFAALGVTQVAAGRRAPDQTLLLQAPVAVVESVVSHSPTVSADGRFVVYAGEGGAGQGADRQGAIWLKDHSDNSLVDLTPPVAGIRPGNSLWPVISGDGCTVTVITEMALDLFRDDDLGGRWDVYRLLLPHCGGEVADWELVSASRGSGFDAAAGDDVSSLYPPAVSADGNQVAYTHQFDVASPDLLGVTVVDLTVALGDPGRALSVPGTPNAAPDSIYRYRGLRQPAMSADGTVVAFTSDAVSEAVANPVADVTTAGVAEWGTGLEQGGFAVSNVFLWDRAAVDAASVGTAAFTGTVVRVSAPIGDETGDSASPALSGDGRFVAFESTATNLVSGATLPPCGSVCPPQVYLYDRTDGSLRLASREPGDPTLPPVGADAGATQPSLNYSGDELLFVSRSSNLFPTRSLGVGDAADGDIVLALPALGTLDRVSVLADGFTPAPAANSYPHMSAAGRVVVFDTLAGSVYGSAQVGRQVAIVDYAPELVLADLDVGTVSVGFPGPEWFLVLSNTGSASFVPATAEVDNADFLISGGSCLEQPTVAVAPGATCTVNLMLMPSVAGSIEGTLTISEQGFNAFSVSTHLVGRGGEPSLAPTPAGAHGGDVLVGVASEPMSFTVENVAFNSVRLDTLEITGANPDDFQLSLDECSSDRLTASSSCAIQVVFTPTASGRRSAQVVMQTRDGGYATVLISGDAFFDPKLAADVTVLAPGRLGLTGTGFAPNADVTVSWADGSGGSLTTVTDAVGGLSAQMVVRATDRSGLRTIVAQTADGQVASAEVLVVPPAPGRGPNSPTWPNR
ncbi:MAG: choice-of-anchor D domain-containing protein [Actinobacteria bacterium]|nr:choice-of-anchor D domain-containing protein [Actinomycetota bacterium]